MKKYSNVIFQTKPFPYCKSVPCNGLNSVEIQERLSLASQLSFVGKNKTKTKNKQKNQKTKNKQKKQTLISQSDYRKISSFKLLQIILSNSHEFNRE